MTTSLARPIAHSSSRPAFKMQTRFWLIIAGLATFVFALSASVSIVNAYNTAYRLFENIAVFYAPKVEASERALQYIARTSQATADYTALSSDTPLYEQAVNDIFRNFNAYRGEMFILQSNLQSADEESAFIVADTFTYSRFWRHVGNLIEGRSDLDLARREYLAADNNLRNRIIPALEALEAENFALMVEAGNNASSAINGQIIGVLLASVLLAGTVTVFSFWLRGHIKRYLTLPLDLAMLLTWLVPLLVVLNLASLPQAISAMTQDAYNSISGSSRVLVVGNQANRTESSAIIDRSRAERWLGEFTAYIELLEVRLCGTNACSQASFLIAGGMNETLAEAAPDSALIANVSSQEEAQTLEEARLALQDYLAIHANLATLISAGDFDAAIELNTGSEEGESETAYERFNTAIVSVQNLNRDVFDDIWQTQQASIPFNRTLYGVFASIAVIILTFVGINQRYREL